MDALLTERGIPIASESLFGNGHRQIIFDLATGDVIALLHSDDFYADNTVLRRVAGPGPPASSRRAFSGLNLPPNRSAITAPPSRCTLNGDVNHQRQ